jgi:hypothetical protein
LVADLKLDDRKALLDTEAMLAGLGGGEPIRSDGRKRWPGCWFDTGTPAR